MSVRICHPVQSEYAVGIGEPSDETKTERLLKRKDIIIAIAVSTGQ